ncbi:MAG: hypothetical protein DRJ10_02630 [Bacteroidetes bacterium]|nr:MAG: hypothetical protein DRJ10_02630 [Bacteroidota bacterium]
MSTKKLIKVIIVEDQKLFANGLKEILNKFEGVEVAKIIENGNLVSKELDTLKADVIFLDLNLIGKNGLEVLQEIREQHSDLLIIILTMYQEKVLVEKAKKLGANAYLTKDATVEELKKALFLKDTDHYFTSKAITNTKQIDSKNNFDDNKILITDREKEVLKCLAKGKTKSELAEILKTSTNTVNIHLKNIQRKLNIYNPQELISYVLNNNII